MSYAVVTAVVALTLVGAVVAACRGEVFDRLVGLQLSGILATLLTVLVALTTGRALVLDVALVVALVALGGGLVYARFLERWL